MKFNISKSGFAAVFGAFALSALTGAIPFNADAQNLQNWLTNEASKIQQDAAGGLINGTQANKLMQRQAQIQGQEQQYAAQNGGALTPQQQQQIGSELRRLNRGVSKDIRRDQQSALNNGAAGWSAYNNGTYPPANVPTGVVNGVPVNAYGQPVSNYVNGAVPAVNGYYPVNNYGQSYNNYSANGNNGQYGNHHHHHHHGMNNGWGGMSNGWGQ